MEKKDRNSWLSIAGRRSPLSPLQNLMGQLKSRVDRQLFDSKNSSPSSQNVSQCAVNNGSFTSLSATTTAAEDNISPGLARLRNTPGKIDS